MTVRTGEAGMPGGARRGRGKRLGAVVAAGLVLAVGGAVAAAPGAAADGALGKTLPSAQHATAPAAASSQQVYRYEEVMPAFKCEAVGYSYLLPYLERGYRAQAYCTFAGLRGTPPLALPYAKLTLIVIG